MPVERMALSTNAQVAAHHRKLVSILGNIGAGAEEALPLLQARFGVASVEDLAAVGKDKLGEALKVDAGHVVLCDKTLQTIFLDNGNQFSETEVQGKVCKKLKQLGLDTLLPDAENKQPFWRKIATGALESTSGVSIAGKRLHIGGEVRVVTSCQPALLIAAPRDEGGVGVVYTEVTDDLLAKVKLMLAQGDKYKGAPVVVPQGAAAVYLKVTVDRPWDRDKTVNSAVDKGVMRDLSNGKECEAAPYYVDTQLDAPTIARIVQATQMALGISAVQPSSSLSSSFSFSLCTPALACPCTENLRDAGVRATRFRACGSLAAGRPRLVCADG